MVKNLTMKPLFNRVSAKPLRMFMMNYTDEIELMEDQDINFDEALSIFNLSMESQARLKFTISEKITFYFKRVFRLMLLKLSKERKFLRESNIKDLEEQYSESYASTRIQQYIHDKEIFVMMFTNSRFFLSYFERQLEHEAENSQRNLDEMNKLIEYAVIFFGEDLNKFGEMNSKEQNQYLKKAENTYLPLVGVVSMFYSKKSNSLIDNIDSLYPRLNDFAFTQVSQIVMALGPNSTKRYGVHLVKRIKNGFCFSYLTSIFQGISRGFFAFKQSHTINVKDVKPLLIQIEAQLLEMMEENRIEINDQAHQRCIPLKIKMLQTTDKYRTPAFFFSDQGQTKRMLVQRGQMVVDLKLISIHDFSQLCFRMGVWDIKTISLWNFLENIFISFVESTSPDKIQFDLGVKDLSSIIAGFSSSRQGTVKFWETCEKVDIYQLFEFMTNRVANDDSS